jgi:hypothetical protein
LRLFALEGLFIAHRVRLLDFRFSRKGLVIMLNRHHLAYTGSTAIALPIMKHGAEVSDKGDGGRSITLDSSLGRPSRKLGWLCSVYLGLALALAGSQAFAQGMVIPESVLNVPPPAQLPQRSAGCPRQQVVQQQPQQVPQQQQGQFDSAVSGIHSLLGAFSRSQR